MCAAIIVFFRNRNDTGKMMRTMKILFAVVCLVFAAHAVPAQAGVLEFFFPMLKNTEPDPSRTLTAPFAEPQAPGQEKVEKGLPENAVPLDYPHRPSAQIGEWVTSAVSEALTFEQDNYQETLTTISKHFDATGKQQYTQFLADNNIIKVLDSKRYYVRGFVREIPLLLNEGAVDNRYHWLYEVPVMVSYMDRNMNGYKNAEPVNQQISLTIQVGRVPGQQTQQDMDIVIERWSGKLQNIAKK
jgi:hypothetical protein